MSKTKHDPYAVLRNVEFRNFQLSRFAFTFAIQMAETIIAWKVYAITHDKLALGLLALAEVLPYIVVSPFSGHVADHFNRYRIVKRGLLFILLVFATIGGLMAGNAPLLNDYGILPIYLILGISGIVRSFLGTSLQTIMPQLVEKELYANAATWGSNVWQTAAVTGPAIGGIIYGLTNLETSFTIVLALLAFSIWAFSRLPERKLPPKEKTESFTQSLTAGLKFVFSNQIMLGAITLDLFAVLFGGAVALLPVFASDILHTGPEGLGFLRAAPFIGSVIMGIFLAHNPPLKNAGRNLLIAVACFGLATIGFALSTNFALSFFMLFLTGAFDNISVVIRQTIMQITTPETMRGRVFAVNSVFIASSNEIGAFESGVAAKLINTVPSVIFGGTMTLLIVATATLFAPKLRKLKM